MEARAEVSIRDRIEDSVRARPRTKTVLWADDVIMVWTMNPPSKRGRWVVHWNASRQCVGQHASLWKCSQLQCKLATTEESRGLDDIKAEFQDFPRRRVCTDVEREGIPPSDAGRPPAALRVVQEEEDKTSALIPTLQPVTSPPPSLPELDSESHRSASSVRRFQSSGQ